MSLSKTQLRRQALTAQYHASKSKPPTRRQVKSWLAPVRKALNELRSGEIDSHRGYAITKIKAGDLDFARVDHAINGFVALIERLMPDVELAPIKTVSRKLTNGVLLTPGEVEASLALLVPVEDRLLTLSRDRLIDAANTEMIAIELDRLGVARN